MYFPDMKSYSFIFHREFKPSNKDKHNSTGLYICRVRRPPAPMDPKRMLLITRPIGPFALYIGLSLFDIARSMDPYVLLVTINTINDC